METGRHSLRHGVGLHLEEMWWLQIGWRYWPSEGRLDADAEVEVEVEVDAMRGGVVSRGVLR